MKAAHRKELEKNVLADRLGRLADNIRKPPQRRTVFIIVGILVVVIAVVVVRRFQEITRIETAQQWVDFGDGYREHIARLSQQTGTVGKAAQFQATWILTWEHGIKQLAADPVGALENLHNAEKSYRDLAAAAANDPVWEPEALYGLAVIEETRAVQHRKHLDEARRLFLELAEKHPQSAYGKLARKRADELKTDTPSRNRIAQFYDHLEISLPPLQAPKS